MQGAFYATPIIYPLALIPVVAAKIIMLNPVAQIIQDARYVLVTDQAQTINQIWGTQSIRLVPYSIVLVSVLVATLYFRARSKYFAEEV